MAMVFRVLQRAAMIALSAAVAVGSAVAPEHVHERDAHHPATTIHRHLQAHHTESSPSSSARFDDDDHDHAIYVSAAWLKTAEYHGPNLSSVLVVFSVHPVPVGLWTPMILDDAAPPHGPPGTPPHSRAPPLLPQA